MKNYSKMMIKKMTMMIRLFFLMEYFIFLNFFILFFNFKFNVILYNILIKNYQRMINFKNN